MFIFFKNRLRQAREWLLDYAYWVTLGAMIAVIVGTALYTDRLRQAENVQAAAPAPLAVAAPALAVAPAATPPPHSARPMPRAPQPRPGSRPPSAPMARLRPSPSRPMRWPGFPILNR